jgi:hypothetical protein
MLLKAAADLDIDLSRSWMIGDRGRDIGAGQRAGCRTIRLRGHEHHTAVGEDGAEEFQADFTARHLVGAARIILREPESPPTPHAAETHETAPARQEGGDSEVRREILRHVRQMVRHHETEEFSVMRLLGGITQMFAGLFLLIAFILAVGYQNTPRGQFWAIVALVCQTASLTFFSMTRNKS